MHLQKTLHFPGMPNVLAGMPWSNEQEDHCLPGASSFPSMHRAVLLCTWSKHAHSKRPHDRKKTEVKMRLLLLPELFYLAHSFPDISPAWCMKHLKQARDYMNLFHRPAMLYVSPFETPRPEVQCILVMSALKKKKTTSLFLSHTC